MYSRFLDNKYTKWYKLIIEAPQLEGYTETHHIIPSSIGGTNDASNLVKLSGKAHLICHMLLTKMVVGHEKHKMIRAFNMTAYAKNSYQMRYQPCSRIYEYLKEQLSLSRSELNIKLWKTPEYRAKVWTLERKVRYSGVTGVIAKRIANDNGAHKQRTTAMWKDPNYRSKVSKARSIAKTTKCEIKGIVYRSLLAATKTCGISGYMLRKDPSFKILS